MDMSAWKNIITKQGGMEYLTCVICDNSRYHDMDPSKPVKDQITFDEGNDAWIFKHAEQPVTINGKQVGETIVEANDSVQALHFCNDLKTKHLIRHDI